MINSPSEILLQRKLYPLLALSRIGQGVFPVLSSCTPSELGGIMSALRVEGEILARTLVWGSIATQTKRLVEIGHGVDNLCQVVGGQEQGEQPRFILGFMTPQICQLGRCP
jgi:hypothetical protein